MKRFYWLVIPLFVFALYWRALGFELACDDWFWHSLGNFNWGLVLGYDNMSVSGFPMAFFRPIPWLITGFLVDLKAPFWVFHLHNILIHCINGILVYFLLRKLNFKELAVWGSLIYVALPYHTDPVTWISGVFSLYFAMFAILMAFALLKGNKLLAWLAMLGGLLSHEMGFGLCLIVPWCFGKDKFYKTMWQFWGATAVFWLIRYWVIGNIGVYGLKFYLHALNPINWLIFIGYFLKWLIP